MRRPRTGIGAELVPLLMILAALAGSLGLVVAAHRRSVKSSLKVPAPEAIVVAKVEPPVSRPAPVPEPEPAPAAPVIPPPPLEDPTPKVLAPLVAAEAEQKAETAQADRRAQALDVARKSAEAELARMQRRESLVRDQLDTLDVKARGIENHAAALAAERDVLARRREVVKVAAEQAKHRPSSAILPHRGPNGTWRRPIAIECRNGQAILQPKGLAFGLLDLTEGFGPTTNPFMAAVVREAVHLQGETAPDGGAVVPYIFFLIRPDGIRPYYEARGRLESLGITFGYELIEQEMEVDFPDLDDVSTWDGSAPKRLAPAPLAQNGSESGSNGTRGKTPSGPSSRGGFGNGSRQTRSGPSEEFVWSMPRLGGVGGTGTSPRGLADEPSSLMPPAIGTGGTADQPGSLHPPGDSPAGTDHGLASDSSGNLPGRELGASAGPETRPEGNQTLATAPGQNDEHSDRSGVSGASELRPPSSHTETADLDGAKAAQVRPGGKPDPGVDFVWSKGRSGGSKQAESVSVDDSSTSAEALESGIPPLPSARDIAARRQDLARSAQTRPSRSGSAPAQGSATDAGGEPKGSPTMAGAGGQPGPRGDGHGPSGPPPSSRFVSPGTIIERPFDLVVNCGPHGAMIQPGGYRVTTKALNARDGLMLEQMKGLVAENRPEDPNSRLNPRVRFLIQPGGEATYRAAKGQLMFSGLNWPTSFQVEGPDPVALLPSETW